MTNTQVGHTKRDATDVYIGRGPNGRDMLSTPIGQRGWLGNPHTVEDHGRAGCIDRFRTAFEHRLENDPEFRARRGDLAVCDGPAGVCRRARDPRPRRVAAKPKMTLNNKRLSLALVVILLAGCSAAPTATLSPTETPTPEPTTRAAAADGDTVTHTFRFRNGEVQVAYPITVVLQTYNGTAWHAAERRTVSELEPFTAELVAGKHYRVIVESADHRRRSLGIYVPQQRGANRTIVIGPCCSDSF